MREHKHRAWDEEHKRMIYETSWRTDNAKGYQEYWRSHIIKVSGSEFLEINYSEQNGLSWGSAETHEGKVMDWVGLKDKNGKDIYEGDIVKFTTWIIKDLKRTKKEVNGEVGFDRTLQSNIIYFDGLHRSFDDFGRILIPEEFKSEFSGKYCNEGIHQGLEVIGNIWKNPELKP